MSWKEVIASEQAKPYYHALKAFVDNAYATKTIYPPKPLIFNAFSKTPIENLKVVILGQDPYHGEGQAQGLAFSTPKNIQNPPSMVNILKEIHSDLGHSSLCLDGDLTPWAKQGVLLINTILTVEQGRAKSHHNQGWESFSDNIIDYIAQHLEGVVFLLWGAPAIAKAKRIDRSRHLILTAPHPSPLSAYRGFFGCKHFSQANAYLKAQGKEAIIW